MQHSGATVDATQSTRPAQRRLAVAVSVVVMIALLALVLLNRNRASAPNADDPNEVVRTMVAAERAGDVETWLGCFAGELRDQLEARLAAGSREQAAGELRHGAARLTGVVTTDSTQLAADRVRVVLERVYTDSNERQELELQRTGGRWQIVRQTVLDRFAPEIPYGTPVFRLPESDATPTAAPATAPTSPQEDSE